MRALSRLDEQQHVVILVRNKGKGEAAAAAGRAVLGVVQSSGMPMSPVSARMGSEARMSSGSLGAKVMCRSHVSPAEM